MLLQFNFKNFKSFRDDTTLDLTATKISEFNNHVVTVANERVLPVAAIFGANASGKSNVQEAFRYMTMYVIDSLDYGDESDSKKKRTKFFRPTPFLFDSKSKIADAIIPPTKIIAKAIIKIFFFISPTPFYESIIP